MFLLLSVESYNQLYIYNTLSWKNVFVFKIIIRFFIVYLYVWFLSHNFALHLKIQLRSVLMLDDKKHIPEINTIKNTDKPHGICRKMEWTMSFLQMTRASLGSLPRWRFADMICTNTFWTTTETTWPLRPLGHWDLLATVTIYVIYEECSK